MGTAAVMAESADLGCILGTLRYRRYSTRA